MGKFATVLMFTCVCCVCVCVRMCTKHYSGVIRSLSAVSNATQSRTAVGLEQKNKYRFWKNSVHGFGVGLQVGGLGFPVLNPSLVKL